MFGLSCRAHCHAVGFLLPRTLSSTCIRLGGCGDVAMVWVSSDLYSSSVFRLLTWYRPVSARSEQCGTEADMRAGAAHKRDVLPHSISGLRSIRWLAPWARTRAVVIGWAQRLGARWHSGRQLLGTDRHGSAAEANPATLSGKRGGRRIPKLLPSVAPCVAFHCVVVAASRSLKSCPAATFSASKCSLIRHRTSAMRTALCERCR